MRAFGMGGLGGGRCAALEVAGEVKNVCVRACVCSGWGGGGRQVRGAGGGGGGVGGGAAGGRPVGRGGGALPGRPDKASQAANISKKSVKHFLKIGNP